MVNIFAVRLRLLLRLLGHRATAGRLGEFRQFLASGSRFRGGRRRSFLGRSTSATPFDQAPPLFQMATAYWISQVIYTAAKLGIADVLSDGPKTTYEVASLVKADEDALRRLLRALCAIEICQITKSGRFELMPLGRSLQSGIPGSLRSMVLTLGEVHYRTWGHLYHTVQSGRPSFRNVFGNEMFEFLERNSRDGETFNLAMTDYSTFVAHAVLLSYDFSGTRSLVDVGGGCGKLLTSILDVYPNMLGVLVDLPGVISEADERIQSYSCRDRCAAIAGNFLESLPRGGETYLLSGVIHDWNDASAQRILTNCSRAMLPKGKVLLVECVVPETDEPSFSKLLDLNMMVMTGGRERTEREFRELLDNSGLKLKKIVRTVAPLRIIEAIRK